MGADAGGAGDGGERFAAALGLSAEEADAVGEAVASQLDGLGLDGAAVFARIRRGLPLAEALGFPGGTADLLYGRAYRWLQVGRPERAEPLFRALCVLDGRIADHWIGYGLCLRERRADQDAALAFETAVRLRPEWAVAHFHAFAQSATLGDWPRADEHWRRFTERADDGTPAAIRDEAKRLRAAVDLHLSTRGGP